MAPQTTPRAPGRDLQRRGEDATRIINPPTCHVDPPGAIGGYSTPAARRQERRDGLPPVLVWKVRLDVRDDPVVRQAADRVDPAIATAYGGQVRSRGGHRRPILPAIGAGPKNLYPIRVLMIDRSSDDVDAPVVSGRHRQLQACDTERRPLRRALRLDVVDVDSCRLTGLNLSADEIDTPAGGSSAQMRACG